MARLDEPTATNEACIDDRYRHRLVHRDRLAHRHRHGMERVRTLPPRTPEHRAKLRAASLAMTPEHRAKISAAALARQTPAYAAKMSVAVRAGLTPEARAKQVLGVRERWAKPRVYSATLAVTLRSRLALVPTVIRVEATRICEHCGQSFTTPWVSKKFCTSRCARRLGHHNKKALIRGRGDGTRVSRSEVLRRDDWVCQLCYRPCDLTAVVPHPEAATLDHIVPLARGGMHTMGNLQTAHFMCNARKGDRGYHPDSVPPQ